MTTFARPTSAVREPVEARKQPIHDVRIIPLRRIPDERGTVMHMLRADDPHFLGFGEIYFSTIYKGVIKGWHWHAEKTLNYACVHGRIKLVLFDDRADSPSCGSLMEIYLGPEQYSLVQIPPRIWNGFKGMTDPLAIVANCTTMPNDPNPAVTRRMDPLDQTIPYSWEVKCC